MGVYQSKTKPEIRKKTAVYTVSLDILEASKKPLLIRGAQLKLGVPSRVKPTFHYHYPQPWLAEMRFNWFEVETT